MPPGEYGVVLVHTMHALFSIERELRARGLEVKAIPTPRHLTSDCGSALRIVMADIVNVRAAIAEKAIETKGIHELDE